MSARGGGGSHRRCVAAAHHGLPSRASRAMPALTILEARHGCAEELEKGRQVARHVGARRAAAQESLHRGCMAAGVDGDVWRRRVAVWVELQRDRGAARGGVVAGDYAQQLGGAERRAVSGAREVDARHAIDSVEADAHGEACCAKGSAGRCRAHRLIHHLHARFCPVAHLGCCTCPTE